jgi:hypothetical protein
MGDRANNFTVSFSLYHKIEQASYKVQLYKTLVGKPLLPQSEIAEVFHSHPTSPLLAEVPFQLQPRQAIGSLGHKFEDWFAQCGRKFR